MQHLTTKFTLVTKIETIVKGTKSDIMKPNFFSKKQIEELN